MFHTKSYRIAGFILIALILFAAGCSSANQSANSTHTPNQPAPTIQSQEPAVTSPAEGSGTDESEVIEDAGKKDLVIASPTDHANDEIDQWLNPEGVEASPEKKEPAKLIDYDVTEPFDHAQLTLMGFTINDSAELIIARFGQPLSITSMKDGADMLNILVYPGFYFGINASNTIEFIEVTSERIKPGLNSFQIGQTVDQAQKALGSADSLNDYVMIYEKNNLTLKCDLDPNTNTVISVKLFES